LDQATAQRAPLPPVGADPSLEIVVLSPRQNFLAVGILLA
jgi:hypothetical protein